MRFGRYHLIKRLASGGMGEVFQASVTGVEGFEKPIALKRIFPHLSESERYRKLFVKEAKVTARLVHPNIVQVYDLGECERQLFIAMEFVRGCDLSAVIDHVASQDERLSAAIAAVIAFDVLEALDFAHTLLGDEGDTLGIVHRDVSPHNILIDRHRGFAKLCDFGIARLNVGSGDFLDGLVVGKLGYMAPEAAFGETVDGRSDLWSLGVVLYEALLAERFVKCDNPVEMAHRLETGDLPKLEDKCSDLPPEIYAILERALKIERRERYQSAGEFRSDIEHFLTTCDPRAARLQLRDIVLGLEPTSIVRHPMDSGPVSAPEGTERWTALVTSVGRAASRETARGSEPNLGADSTLQKGFELDSRASPDSAADSESDPDAWSESERDPGTTRKTRWWARAGSGIRTWIADSAAQGSSVTTGKRAALAAICAGVLVGIVSSVWSADGGDEVAPPIMEPAAPEDDVGDVTGVADATGVVTGSDGDDGALQEASSDRGSASTRRRPTVRKKKPLAGFLSLSVKPWARVAIDGVPLETSAPFRKHRIDAGTHSVVLTGPDGRKKTLEVFIPAAKTVVRVITFD